MTALTDPTTDPTADTLDSTGPTQGLVHPTTWVAVLTVALIVAWAAGATGIWGFFLLAAGILAAPIVVEHGVTLADSLADFWHGDYRD